MEKHRICFRDVETGWYNALPLGNGRMGAMVYYRGGKLCIALNHYDCYYHVLAQYARHEAHMPEGGENPDNPAVFDDPARKEKTFDELRKIVDKARKEPGYERSHYLRILNSQQKGRPVYGGGSYPQGGEVHLVLSEKADCRESILELSIEDAKIHFSAGPQGRRAEAEIWVDPGCDGVMIRVSQDTQGLWDHARIWKQEARGQGGYIYENENEGEILAQTCLFRPDGEAACTDPFVQETALYIPGSSGDGRIPKEKGIHVITASIQPGKGNAGRLVQELWRDREESKARHSRKWREFWRSSVSLPDQYLETLWHLYVYLMECGSGDGSAHSEQACGLSGLWDIRRPCMWGSMWYWDVNIQTAFYGSFASNHMEQVKVFCDAFLSYRKEAHRFAERIYGKTGWALDYPHPLYNCIQPWCALFLWQYYAYTKDEEFLREKAYPAFCEMLDFYREISSLDENGIRHIDYDICPEQGNVTRDSTITVAAVKQLAEYTLRSAKILDRPEKERRETAQLLKEMPEYARTADGRRWKDSPLVQDDIFLRHPSVLMPVFPAEEVHMESPDSLRKTAEETVRHASENTEAGTFGFEWIAAAAARLGAGESAVRILYEKGLDFMTHSNGLGYEESERFINYCHLTKPANYLPVMCEEAGGTAAVISMLLVQEMDGVIHVFPAVPDGDDGYASEKTQYVHDDHIVSAKYGPWEECGFESLLVPGGFEISAQMRGGKTTWIQVTCRAAGRLRIAVPENLERAAEAWCGEETLPAEKSAVKRRQENKTCRLHAAGRCRNGEKIYEIELRSGEVLVLGRREPDDEAEQAAGLTPGEDAGQKERKDCAREAAGGILTHRAARTHRRTFIGEDRHTRFYKAMDSMVCPYGYAESLHYGMTPYVFDFTEQTGKDYDDVYEKQILEAGRCVLYAGGPRPVGAQRWCADRGYGFLSGGDTRITKRTGPDSVRRDFAEGSEEAVFGVELPAGKYDILIVSGDEEAPSATHISVPTCGVCLEGEETAAGRYQCRIIPVMHMEDGVLKIVLGTEKGLKWKMNAVFINKQYMLL